MQRRQFLKASLVAATAAGVSPAGGDTERAEAGPAPQRASCDTFVYGSTPGGIAAAVEAARRGDRVALACPKGNPGGMAASGLSTTDAVRRHLFGGFVIELISRIRDRYRQILGDDQGQWKLVHLQRMCFAVQ